MKKIFILMPVMILLVSFMVSALTFIDSYEELNSEDKATINICQTGYYLGQPFNTSVALSAGDTVYISFWWNDNTQNLGAGDVVNMSIMAGDSSGVPTGSIYYGWKAYSGDWVVDEDGWSKNWTIVLDYDMPAGGAVGEEGNGYIFSAKINHNDGSLERIGFSYDRASTDPKRVIYEGMEINTCDALTGTVAESTDDTIPYMISAEITLPDTAPPFFVSNAVNDSYPATDETVNFSITIVDDINVSGYIFSYYNETDDKWFNLSYVDDVALNISVYTIQVVSDFYYFNYTWFANDTSGNMNQSDIYSLQINNYPPIFTSQVKNQTLIYYLSSVEMNINISDPNPKRNRFAWNITGSWVNDGYQPFDDGDNVSTIKQITLPHIKGVCWRVWAEDRGKNGNTSEEDCFDILNTPAINATVIHPVNTSNNTVLNFTFTSYDYDGDTVVFLIYLNGVLETNSTTNITDYDLADGKYNLTVGVYDGYDYSGNSSTTSFRMSTVVGEVEEEEEEVLVIGECPAGSTQEVMLFAFIGFFLLAILVLSMTLIRIPFMTILMGIAFIMFGFLLYPCNALIAMVISFFAVGLIVFEFSQSGNTSIMG